MIPVDALPVKDTPPLDLLSGVRVLDLTTSIAGPYATQLLGDLGASVVKIEKPAGGDDARAWGPPFLDGESLWFSCVNRNKRSLALDVGTEAGYALFVRLVAQTDVLVVNLVPPVQAKLRVDYATLRAIRPDLVHVSITGFGLSGRRAHLPCYDLIAEGYSGVMDLTGEPDHGPQKVGTAAADLLAGMDAALAAVAALLRRQRDGRGCQVDVSMVESMVRFVAPRLSSYLGSGEVPRRSGGRDSVIAIYQVFETADLPLTLGLGNDAIWRRFWEALGRPELGAEACHATNAARREHRAQIVAQIQELLRQRPRAHWLELFAQAKVPAGPINRADEVTADRELIESGLFYACVNGHRRLPQIGLGIKFDGRAEACALAPPALGEGTEEVLREWLGTAAPDIGQLRQGER